MITIIRIKDFSYHNLMKLIKIFVQIYSTDIFRELFMHNNMNIT